MSEPVTVKLSDLMRLAHEPTPPGVDALDFHWFPPIRGRGVGEPAQVLYRTSTLKLDHCGGRPAWRYAGEVILDVWTLEQEEREQRAQIASLNGEIADLKRLFGHSTDNSPALGGQKETT